MNKLSIEDLLQGRTLEETVDHALRAVVKQGRLSGSQGFCYYRDPKDSNVRCIIGHMIPDSLYNKAMEGQTAFGIVSCKENEDIRNFLCSLQYRHDDPHVKDIDTMLGHALDLGHGKTDEYPWLSPLVQRIIDDKESGRL